MATGTADLLEMKPGEEEVDLRKEKTDEKTSLWRRPSLATGSASSLLVEPDLLVINCSGLDQLQPGFRESLQQNQPWLTGQGHPAGQGAARYTGRQAAGE